MFFYGFIKVGTGGMDSKVNAATWALDRGVSVVICNGTQDKAIKTIIAGRKVGTFFTETLSGGPTPVDTLAENGKDLCKRYFDYYSTTSYFEFARGRMFFFPFVVLQQQTLH